MNIEKIQYQKLVSDLKDKIRKARQKASLAVNKELLLIYWEIGRAILLQQKEEGWGAKIVDQLSKDLRTDFPDFKGLSVKEFEVYASFC